TRQKWLAGFAAVTMAAAGCARTAQQAGNATGVPAGQQKMNVLLIVSDDLCNDLGCYGAPVKTPNVDRLAERGVRFERAYCQYPVSNPSRTSILSGLRPSRTGVMSNSTHPIPDRSDPPLLPRFLKERGYFSVRVGKVFHDSRRVL